MPRIPQGPPGLDDIVDTDRLHFQAYNDSSTDELKALEGLLHEVVGNTKDISLLKGDIRRLVAENGKITSWLGDIAGLLSSNLPVIKNNSTAEFEYWRNKASRTDDLLAAIIHEFPDSLSNTADRVDKLGEHLEALADAVRSQSAPPEPPNRKPLARVSPEPLSAPSQAQVRRAFALAETLPNPTESRVAAQDSVTVSELTVTVNLPESDVKLDSGVLEALASINQNLVRLYEHSVKNAETVKDKLPVFEDRRQPPPLARLLAAPTTSGAVIDAEYTQIHNRSAPTPSVADIKPAELSSTPEYTQPAQSQPLLPQQATPAPVLLPAPPAPTTQSATPLVRTLPAPVPAEAKVEPLSQQAIPAPTVQPSAVLTQKAHPAPVDAADSKGSEYRKHERKEAKKSYLSDWKARAAKRLDQLHADRKETEAANEKHRNDYASRLAAQEQAKREKQQLALMQQQQQQPAQQDSGGLLADAAEAAGDLLNRRKDTGGSWGKRKYRYVGREAPPLGGGAGGVPPGGSSGAGAGGIGRSGKFLGRAGGALALAGGAYMLYDALSSDKDTVEKSKDVGGAIGSTAGGLAGAAAGGQAGLAIGTALAPFTAGISIPVATALGVVGGGIAGAFGGESIGRAGGGAIGTLLPSAEPTKQEQKVEDKLPKAETYVMSAAQKSASYQPLIAQGSFFGSIDYDKLKANYGDSNAKGYHAATASLAAYAQSGGSTHKEEPAYPYLMQVPYVEKVAPSPSKDPSLLAVSGGLTGKAEFAEKTAAEVARIKVDSSSLDKLPDQMGDMTKKLERDSRKSVESTVASNNEMVTATKSWADKALDFFKEVKDDVAKFGSSLWGGVQTAGRAVANTAEAAKEGVKTAYQVATGQKDVAGSASQSLPKRLGTAVSEGANAAVQSAVGGRTAIGSFTEREESGAKGASALNLNDVNNIAYGKIQFNSKYGNFQKVMQQYLANGDKSSANYQKIAQYKDVLTSTSNTGAIRDAVRGDKGLQDALKGAGKEDAMKTAQDNVARTEYAAPTSALMKKIGAKSVASSQVLYDAAVQGGAPGAASIAKETTARLGGNIGDVGSDGQVITEQTYANKFLDVRKGRLLKSNKQAAATAGPRIDNLRKIANDQSLLGLQYDPNTQNVKTDEKGNLVTVAGSTVAPESVSGVTRKDSTGVRAEAWQNANPTAARNMQGIGAGAQTAAGNAMYREAAKTAATGMVQNANDVMYKEINRTLGVPYEYSKKDINKTIDCSGYVAHLNTTTMDAMNQQLGTTVFSKKDKALLQTSAAEQIRGIGAATGKEYSKEEMMAPGGLREGMIIGEDHPGARSDKDGGRYKGIDHVVQVVKNPKTGELEIAQASSKKGTWTQPLEQWKADRLKKGTKLYGADPMLLAKNLPPEAAAAKEQAKKDGKSDGTATATPTTTAPSATPTTAESAKNPAATTTQVGSQPTTQTASADTAKTQQAPGTTPAASPAAPKPKTNQKPPIKTASLPKNPDAWRQSSAKTAANAERVTQPVSLSAQQSDDMDNIFRELSSIPGVQVSGGKATVPAVAETQNGYTTLSTANGAVPQSWLSQLGVNYPAPDKIGGYAEKAVGLLRKYGGERGNELAQKVSQVTQGLGGLGRVGGMLPGITPGFNPNATTAPAQAAAMNTNMPVVGGSLGLPGMTPGFNPSGGGSLGLPGMTPGFNPNTGSGAYQRSVGSLGGLGDVLRTAATYSGRPELASYAAKLDAAPQYLAKAESAFQKVSGFFAPTQEKTLPPVVTTATTAPDKTTNPNVIATQPMTESTGQSILASTRTPPTESVSVSPLQTSPLQTAGTSMAITIDEFSLTAKAAYETLVLGKG